MSRRPLTSQRFEQVRFASLSQTEGYLEVIARNRRDVFDEPSTGVRKKSTTKKRAPNYKRALAEATVYGGQVVQGLWECAEPKHLVGLYASLHAHLYGVQALELQQEYGAALSSATKLVKEEFKGDAFAAQSYVAWCFARARKWKKQLEDDGTEIVRVGWRLVFKSRKWLVDWKANGRG